MIFIKICDVWCKIRSGSDRPSAESAIIDRYARNDVWTTLTDSEEDIKTTNN